MEMRRGTGLRALENARIATSIFLVVGILSPAAPAVADAPPANGCTMVDALWLRPTFQVRGPFTSTLGQECVEVSMGLPSQICASVGYADETGVLGPVMLPCPSPFSEVSESLSALETLALARLESAVAFAAGEVPFAASEPGSADFLLASTLALLGLQTPASEREQALNSYQCRTARTAEGGGEWSLVIPSESIEALVPADQSTLDNYAAIGALTAPIPDEGQVSQNICYDPGAWTEYPPTRRPPSEAAVRQELNQCRVSIMFLAVAVIITAESFGAGLALVIPATAAVVKNCQEWKDAKSDTGYMNCRGAAYVTWGGEGGNAYVSDLGSLEVLGILGIEAGSQGAGYQKTAYDKVLYDGPGYDAGAAACNQQLQLERERAYQDYLHWNTTASGTTQGTASIKATLRPSAKYDAELGVRRHLGAAGDIYQLMGPIFTDGGNALLIGCETTDCDLEVSLEVAACGLQTITPGKEGVTYEFTGWPGCITVRLTIGVDHYDVQVPYLRLDGDFTGGGGSSRVYTAREVL